MSVEEAKEEIRKIRQDTSHPYHQGEKHARARMDSLYKIAYPPGSKVEY